MGTYVLPMPNGDTVKKALYRQLRRERILISNRYMATRLLVGSSGRVAGIVACNTRDGTFLTVRAKAVVMCMGAAGRLGLPVSGYLYGTYENPSNSGEGYAMAYHAGAALANLECFQINPLIKDYNGPSCAYVAGPFGGYTANSRDERFIECDYWSGQMMQEFYQELMSGKGPVYLKLNHLQPETAEHIEDILADPHAAAVSVGGFLGLEMDDAGLASVVEASSFARMREIERREVSERRPGFFRERHKTGVASRGVWFTNRGTSGGGRAVLTEEEAAG